MEGVQTISPKPPEYRQFSVPSYSKSRIVFNLPVYRNCSCVRCQLTHRTSTALVQIRKSHSFPSQLQRDFKGTKGTAAYNYLKGSYEDDGDKLFLVVTANVKRGNHHIGFGWALRKIQRHGGTSVLGGFKDLARQAIVLLWQGFQRCLQLAFLWHHEVRYPFSVDWLT